LDVPAEFSARIPLIVGVCVRIQSWADGEDADGDGDGDADGDGDGDSVSDSDHSTRST